MRAIKDRLWNDSLFWFPVAISVIVICFLVNDWIRTPWDYVEVSGSIVKVDSFYRIPRIQFVVRNNNAEYFGEDYQTRFPNLPVYAGEQRIFYQSTAHPERISPHRPSASSFLKLNSNLLIFVFIIWIAFFISFGRRRL